MRPPNLPRLSQKMKMPATEVFIFALVMGIYGYFYSNGGASQNARLDSIYAFVEPGHKESYTFRINRFLPLPLEGINTLDWAFYDGNFYSNKAPGTTFVGIPFYFIIFYTEKLLGMDISNPYIEILNAYLLNFIISIIPVAVAGVLFFRIANLHFSLSEKKSLFCTLILLFGTPLFPYSIQLWGHTTAAAFLVFSLYFLLASKESNSLFWSGFWIGLATLTDYFCGIFAFIMTVILLLREKKNCIYFIAGGLIPCLALLAYQTACFGSPLSVSITQSVFKQENEFLGAFRPPRLKALYYILLSPKRGLFAHTPILAISLVAIFYAFKKNKNMIPLYLSASCILAAVIANSSFNIWWGGASTCLRYLICSMPLWILLLAYLPAGKPIFLLAVSLFAFSFFNMLAVASVSPEYLVDTANPLYGWTYEMFFSGNMSVFKSPIRLQFFHPQWEQFKYWTSWNIGMLVGMKGFASLLPLFLFVSTASLGYCAISRQKISGKGLCPK